MKQKIRFARIIVMVLFLTLAAPALLSPVFAEGTPAPPTKVTAKSVQGGECAKGMTCKNGIAFPETGLPDTRIQDILLNFMRWLLGIFGLIAIITFIIAGIQYILAAGNPDSAKKAKQNIIYSIIGIAVALSGYIIILAISNFLGGYSDF